MDVQFDGYPNIVATADTCLGQPRIANTRITVSAILAHLASGSTINDLVTDFGTITAEQAKEAIAFASESLLNTRHIPFSYKTAS